MQHISASGRDSLSLLSTRNTPASFPSPYSFPIIYKSKCRLPQLHPLKVIDGEPTDAMPLLVKVGINIRSLFLPKGQKSPMKVIRLYCARQPQRNFEHLEVE